MTPSQLNAWMKAMDFNKVRASKELGIARFTLDGYLNGKQPIPRYIELACEALSLRWKQP